LALGSAERFFRGLLSFGQIVFDSILIDNPPFIKLHVTLCTMLKTKQKAHSISHINAYIKDTLEEEPFLQDIWITGEITNLRFYAQGQQLYFNLTDGQSVINCVMYSNFLRLLKWKPDNGQLVFARGKVKVFNKKGTYIFQAAFLNQDGLGQENLKFEALKQALLKEGLFDPDCKKPIPRYPRSIGVITSHDSAAMWDFVKICRDTCHYFSINIIPAVMQGAQSAFSIIEALDQSEKHAFDVIVIIRGGGSQEDLASFNDELLVRRLFQHEIPVISGIGHEVDVTLTDFVSDLRCSTPTAVAKHLSQPFDDLVQFLEQTLVSIESSMDYQLTQTKDRLIQSLEKIQSLTSTRHQHVTQHFELLSKQLAYANPLHQLKRGYSVTRLRSSQQIITSVKDVALDDMIQVRLRDGHIEGVITKKHDNI